MASPDLDRLRALYADWARGDLRPGSDLFAPDIVFVPVLDGGAAVVGREAAADYMRGFLDQWDGFRVEAEEMAEVGDLIVVTERQRGTGKTSRLEMSQTAYAVWRFEGGLVVEVRWDLDRARALAAAGAPR